MWMMLPLLKRSPEGDRSRRGKILLKTAGCVVFCFVLSIAFAGLIVSQGADEGNFGSAEGFGTPDSEETQCMAQCLRRHPKWGYPVCSEDAKGYIFGSGCYEQYDECFLECNDPWETAQESFTPAPDQLENYWRQESACGSDVTRIPLDRLPGDALIDPRWSGRCECLNGRLVVGKCGHREATCNEVCQTGVAF